MRDLADAIAAAAADNQPTWDELQAWMERARSKEESLDLEGLGDELEQLSILDDLLPGEWGLDLIKEIKHEVEVMNASTNTSAIYDLQWLRGEVSRIFSADIVEEMTEGICSQLTNPDEMVLAEILGYDHLDLVTLVIEHKQTISDHWELERLEKRQQQGGLNRAESAELMRLRERLGVKVQFELSSSAALGSNKVYPNVYDEAVLPINPKTALPEGTERNDLSTHEEFVVPYQAGLNAKASRIKIIGMDDMEKWCQPAFPHYTQLNRMQSAVYPVAFGTQENMLVCAPTGAGKTDVAMLAILRCLADYHRRSLPFKIIYVAPMKALAAEVADKFSLRLAPFKVKVRECTGDMQLSRQEIRETHMLVTTPEKWDVLTRHGQGDGGLVGMVRLLIIDEVHLLQDDRGPVIESLVARTLRLVETEQRLIRLVGLSATLPNYIDVALLLRVNLQVGLFSFDSSFRPVPLRQTFIGIKGHSRSTILENTNTVCFNQMMQYAQQGHQVMIFVHARTETLKTARTMLRMASDRGVTIAPLDPEDCLNPQLKQAVYLMLLSFRFPVQGIVTW